MQPSRVAIYARVSDPNAPEGTIASQVAALEARLAQDGVRLEPECRFVDDGYTGATLVRPALERLRDAAAAAVLDRLYVHCPDRLARHYAYQVLLIDEFRRAGVEVVFLNRAIGTSPEDDLLLQVQGMVAEYERAKIRERSRRGKRHAAAHGVINVLSGAPYGYHYVNRHAGGGAARYEVREEEAAVVRQIFRWIGQDRLSIGAVCRRLQQLGQLTRTGNTRWERKTVWGILRNPAYIGSAAFGKTRVASTPTRLRPIRGAAEQPRRASRVSDVPAEEWIRVPVPALVEPELFDAVQAQLAENRARSRQRTDGGRYLLQGLLVCQQCGYAYYGKTTSPLRAGKPRRTHAYYRCCGSDTRRFGGQKVCCNPSVRTDRLDAVVWQEVERLLQDPGRLAGEYQRRLDEAHRGGHERADIATLEMAKLRRGIGRLIDSYAEGMIDKVDFDPRITGLRQRLVNLEDCCKVLRDRAAVQTTLSLIIGRLEDFAHRVRDTLSASDWHQRRELIRLLVKRVEIDVDAINIVFRVAPAPSGPGPAELRSPSLQDCGWRGGPAARRCRAQHHRRHRAGPARLPHPVDCLEWANGLAA